MGGRLTWPGGFVLLNTTEMKNIPDPFEEARKDGPVMKCPVHGENIAMLLKHADVRAAAKDWTLFSSDAPFRVPIPSEEEVRSIRQLPIETDPPEHTEWRAIVQPFFDQPKKPEFAAKVEALIDELVAQHLPGIEAELRERLAQLGQKELSAMRKRSK